MDRAERIMDEDLHFPIRMLDDRWVRSDDHQLTIRSERDMALFGIIVFDNFISGSDSDSTVITFEQWADLLAVRRPGRCNRPVPIVACVRTKQTRSVRFACSSTISAGSTRRWTFRNSPPAPCVTFERVGTLANAS